MAQCAHEVVSFGEFTDDGMRVVGIDGTQILLIREGDALLPAHVNQESLRLRAQAHEAQDAAAVLRRAGKQHGRAGGDGRGSGPHGTVNERGAVMPAAASRARRTGCSGVLYLEPRRLEFTARRSC